MSSCMSAHVSRKLAVKLQKNGDEQVISNHGTGAAR